MIIIVMGTSGSGKSTVGKRLANVLRWTFVDADAYHSPANIEKMGHGIPLTDEDRLPWLMELRGHVGRWLEEGKNVVLACSALKAAYRDLLMADQKQMQLVYLKGSYELFRDRMLHRQHHYMPEELLRSQFEILEEPADALTVDAEGPPEVLVQNIRTGLQI
ncbi:MAG TPA: gluconokinase [Nitrospiraceae bacterium]|nr:gluconokinase [Nitrospiraceae bacterium]